MTTEPDRTEPESASTFADQASEAPPGIVQEFWEFLRDNKKWWLTPIVLVLLLVGLLVIMSGSAAAPFIYTLF